MATIVGRIAVSAETTTVEGDKQVTNFTVAVNDGYYDKANTWVEQVEFFRCGMWYGHEKAARLKKGAVVEVSGRLYATAYMKGSDAVGQINIAVDKVKVVSPAKDATSEAQATTALVTEPAEPSGKQRKQKPAKGKPQPVQTQAPLAEVSDDLPF